MWQNSNVFKVRIVLLLRIQMLFEKNNWKLWMWARVRECLHSNWHAQKFSNPNVHSVMLMLMLTVNKVYFSVGCCLFFRWNWAQILMYIVHTTTAAAVTEFWSRFRIIAIVRICSNLCALLQHDLRCYTGSCAEFRAGSSLSSFSYVHFVIQSITERVSYQFRCTTNLFQKRKPYTV